MAPGLANEAIHLAQAQTRALSGAFGREEGVEGLCDDFRRHACARVGDRDEHVLTGLDRVFLGVSVIHKSVHGLDGEPAAARHCIARVDREVEDRVLKLRRIRLDLPQAGGQHGLDFDLLAKRAVEQLAHAGDQLVDDQGLGRKRLLARERQKPLRERRRALGAVDGGFDEPFNVGLAARQLALQEVKAAHDDGEHVVEVVGDAAGELADRLHLLDLAELLLDLGAGVRLRR